MWTPMIGFQAWYIINNTVNIPGVPYGASRSAGAQFPLRAASYSSCDVDLGSKGWTKDLIAAGFDPEVPTVWIAEGLFMYLSEAAVTTLMKEARAVSAKGSRLLIMVRSQLPFHFISSTMILRSDSVCSDVLHVKLSCDDLSTVVAGFHDKGSDTVVPEHRHPISGALGEGAGQHIQVCISQGLEAICQ